MALPRRYAAGLRLAGSAPLRVRGLWPPGRRPL